VSDAAALAAAPPPPPTAAIETPVLARESGGLWLQIGAFSSAESAESFRDHVGRELTWLNEPIQVSSRDGMHRVRLGPYRNVDEAAAIGDKVRRTLGVAPLLVR
jgi:rare lipoprotein A